MTFLGMEAARKGSSFSSFFIVALNSGPGTGSVGSGILMPVLVLVLEAQDMTQLP